ncbi:MAG: hypothetical protein NTU44_14455 [Bacteroidetes bacterium]|nr:hypothetical protein [Bacteroidota bacterium]
MERKHKDKHRKNAGNVAGLGLLRFLLTIFVLSLVFFSLHRFILVFLHRDQLDKAHLRLLWYCFFNRGLLFDTVTTTYLMILPAVILIITFLTGRTGYFIRKLVVVLLSADFIFGLAVSIADIPYFAFYNARVNRVILSWTDDLPLMLSAMVRNVYYIRGAGIFYHQGAEPVLIPDDDGSGAQPACSLVGQDTPFTAGPVGIVPRAPRRC